MYMEGNFIKNVCNKVKNKFNKKKDYPHINDYSFSGEELRSLSKQNMEEIDKLRHGYKKEDTISVKDDIENKDDNDKKEEIDIINSDKEIDVDSNSESLGYINLSNERRENIMKRWNSIDYLSLTNDIEKGKDILEHNYVITYPDDALAYIYKIRDEYDILIEYLIGFNNEKKGIFEKNIFSSKLEDEWKYLNSYIKVLEKIKGAIKR